MQEFSFVLFIFWCEEELLESIKQFVFCGIQYMQQLSARTSQYCWICKGLHTIPLVGYTGYVVVGPLGCRFPPPHLVFDFVGS